MPGNCRSAQRVAVVLPYREAQAQLRVVLHNLLTVLHAQMLDFTVFVIEQERPSQYNRALLFNVGFLEASVLRDYDCFLFHDLDLVMVDDRVTLTCGTGPRHLTLEPGLRPGYGPENANMFAGVALFTRDQYIRINGASNLFFGIDGGEDDLWRRVHHSNMMMSRVAGSVVAYSQVRHSEQLEEDKDKVARKLRKELLRRSAERIPEDGLTSLTYSKLSHAYTQLAIWIKVAVDQNLIQQVRGVSSVP
ncbi:beta-1,4-N-acetylgalactosaminyltransferase bre-4 [Aplysia californica]|uniref:Beta-1,4-N-acetylgalactosaminyltransferase bre-4 n=1 Tax=Aplysia californica TaxID=6500 RepID=A0ABM1A4Y2_APLCA|nr:beta-1,4-N-acetylgalactosaminyltransferase bre-4 [Aplysia californica]